VRVKAAGIKPGEAVIREGLSHERWPATFPSGQGSDLAGVIAEVGAGVEGFGVGDEVIGFTHDRASQAELVVVDAQNLTPRPSAVPWQAAGALFVAGSTAYAASHPRCHRQQRPRRVHRHLRLRLRRPRDRTRRRTASRRHDHRL
jgi:NADPH:quinone reductase-like Zn-dependent oxidoreductase